MAQYTRDQHYVSVWGPYEASDGIETFAEWAVAICDDDGEPVEDLGRFISRQIAEGVGAHVADGLGLELVCD
jgi:hypothetical protein